MAKSPVNRTVGGHIKEGFKNIKTTYKALYNNDAPKDMGGGKNTAKTNVKAITTGKMGSRTMTAGGRAGLAAIGVASVTPVGPIAAFALGVKKSVKEQKKAINVRDGVTTAKKGKIINLQVKPKTGKKA